MLFNIYILASGRTYLYKTFIYTYADIDDQKLFHTRTVRASSHPEPWPFSKDYNKEQLPDSLEKFLAANETVSFLVLKDDSLRYEKYWENYTDTTSSNSFSMAKSIIGTLIGIAIQEGKINSIDDKVSDYIPEYKKGPRAALTVRHLLTMSAALRWDEAYSSAWSVTTEAYYGTDLHELLMREDVVAEPGKEFNYQSGSTQLLAFILMKATGKNVSDYASEKLWQPLGAEHPALWSLDHKNGVEKAYCCFYSTARDFARLGELYMHNGNWKGKQIIDSNWVAMSTHTAPLIDHDTQKPNDEYGYQWWVGPDYYYCRGLQGQYIIVLPEMHTVIVRLGHKRPDKSPDGKLTDVPYYVSVVRTWLKGRA